METQDCSLSEVERLKSVIATLRARILILQAELDRLRSKLTSTWGDA